MFYYPNVLHRHTGCFSTIWLAATSGIRVTRRELLRVDVKQTCSDILDYVTAQVPPPQPNLPRPRFSLYLSSQLQYGVVLVYHRQCAFLLEETEQAIDRLLRSKRCVHIDIAESDRLCLDVPNNMYMMEEAEGAQDPFFGLMESHQLPSPYNLHKTEFLIEEVGSQLFLLSSTHATPDKEGFRSPPAAITLTEKEQLAVTTAQCFEGDDLPEATAREIDLLMHQPEQFRRGAEDRIRETEGTISSLDQLRETVLGTEQDSVWLLDEELGQPVEAPPAAVAAVSEMTPLQIAMPTPPSVASGKEGRQMTEGLNEEVVVRPCRRPGGGHRRQLVFADPEVQISNKAIKEQIGNPLIETLDLSEMLLDLASLNKWASPAELYNTPCGSLLHADLQSLWKKCAFLTALPGEEEKQQQEADELSGESEQDREILRTERKRRHSNLKEFSSESGLQPPEGSSASDIILNMLKDRSANETVVVTPVSRWSPLEEARPSMEPIAEENIEMPEAQTESSEMLSWIWSSLHRFGEVTFDSLLPPEADRTTAAHTLLKLLELLSAGQVAVCQTEPYSNMTINPAAQ
ncbi:REC8 meiotic recombination protein b [Mastacembelus armatus]|uniref:REC8 meiotic recombination protein b n=1 Tax=Mastacembelus armatus TaxID=205130 RepID=UPI000E45635C|nr:meiotic recombination protein REC8 homolog [Mastacembelus armatus]